ncbi:hypothetical protein [Paraburkholderia tropica]|uniref:hypothetical protein n=1 Tax=Paraburkholderia tropica TaxID=92647 RepID=UPI003D279AF0
MKMKPLFMAALLCACAYVHAQTTSDGAPGAQLSQPLSAKELRTVVAAPARSEALAVQAQADRAAQDSLSATDTKTELLGFETVRYGTQEVRLELSKETVLHGKHAGNHAFCRQYVQTYAHEIGTSELSNSQSSDKTTIVLGKTCVWARG